MEYTLPGPEPIFFNVPTNKGTEEKLVNYGLTKKMSSLMIEFTKIDISKVDTMDEAISKTVAFLSLFFDKKPGFLQENFSDDMLLIMFVKAGEAITARINNARKGAEKNLLGELSAN